MENCFCKNSDLQTESDVEQKFVYKLRNFYINTIHKELENVGYNEYWSCYQNLIMKNINMSIIKSTLSIVDQCGFAKQDEINEVLKQYRQNLESIGCIVEPKEFVANLVAKVRENEELEKFVYEE